MHQEEEGISADAISQKSRMQITLSPTQRKYTLQTISFFSNLNKIFVNNSK